MVELTPEEAQILRGLAEDLFSASQQRTYWLDRTRRTSLDLLARITSWLDDACPGRHPVHQSTCLRPQGHDGDCTDAYDRTWTAPVVTEPRRESLHLTAVSPALRSALAAALLRTVEP